MDHHGLMVHTVARRLPVDTPEHARRREELFRFELEAREARRRRRRERVGRAWAPSSPLSEAAIGRRGPARRSDERALVREPAVAGAPRRAAAPARVDRPGSAAEAASADSDESGGSGRRPRGRVDGVPAGPAGATPPREIEPYLAFFAVAREA